MSDLSRAMLEREWLGKTLGIEFTETTPARVVATMPVTPAHHQPFGYLHGGASVALAETVASVGGMLNVPPGKVVFGQVIDANHVRPRQSGTLRAIGTPLHIGRPRRSGISGSSTRMTSWCVFHAAPWRSCRPTAGAR